MACKSSGTIIILNGPSGCGKSTIQKKVQEYFNELYLTIGIDGFFDEILPEIDPKELSSTPGSIQWVTKNDERVRGTSNSQDQQGNQIVSLHVGPAGQRVIRGMHRALAAYASVGNNVVVDYILYDSAWLPDLVDCLKDFRVYFIGVHAPLRVIEGRERARGTTPLGHARSHYDQIHAHSIYDLELDTSKLTPQACVLKIKEYISKHPEPQAFNTLREKLKK